MRDRIGSELKLFGVLSAVAALLLSGAELAQAQTRVSQVIIEQVANKPYAQTLAKLEAAIKGAKFMIIGEPNYQMMQRMVGRERRGSKAFFIFRPDLGIPIFDNDYNAAMEIPLKILIYEREDKKTVIRYKQPSSALADYKGLQSFGQTLDKTLADLVAAALK